MSHCSICGWFIRSIFAILIGVAALSFTSRAQSAVITFNGHVPEANVFEPTTDTYSEAGFTFAFFNFDSNFGTFFTDNNNGNHPSLITFDDDVLVFSSVPAFPDPFFVLTRDGGGLFDLLSVRTGSLGTNASLPTLPDEDGDFLFTGHFGAGGTIAEVVLGVKEPATTNFSGYLGLSSLVVICGDCSSPVLDDLTVVPSAVAPIPIPAALPLFGTGLGILGFVGWRRRRRQAQAV